MAQVTDAKAKVKADQDRILATLAELGGKLFQDDDVTHGGSKLNLPEGMTLDQAIRFLERKRDEQERAAAFARTYDYRPFDGAYCMWKAMKRTFGSVGHRGTMGFWGPNPPQMISVSVDVGRKEQIPWGRFDLPFLPGATFTTAEFEHPEYGMLFQLYANAPKKFAAEVEGVFNLIQSELETSSMYRGKAFDGQAVPEFVDLSSVDPRRVVYSEEVMTQLETNVWAQLRYSDEFEAMGVPLKRAVLVHGPYGTGKTLAAILTGQEAVKHGHTFIKARPGHDDLSAVLQTARLYQPAVVFYEDVDTIASPTPNGEGSIARLLDDFDGIEAKGTKILCVLTTNHPERIHKAMARPGRLDAMIEINELDQHGIEKLVRTRIEDQLDPDVDWAAVFESAEGYKPAFVTEGADRALRYAFVRNGGEAEGIAITTADLCNSMAGLRPQYDLSSEAKDTAQRDPLSEVTKDTLRPVVVQAVRDNIDPKLLRKQMPKVG